MSYRFKEHLDRNSSPNTDSDRSLYRSTSPPKTLSSGGINAASQGDDKSLPVSSSSEKLHGQPCQSHRRENEYFDDPGILDLFKDSSFNHSSINCSENMPSSNPDIVNQSTAFMDHSQSPDANRLYYLQNKYINNTNIHHQNPNAPSEHQRNEPQMSSLQAPDTHPHMATYSKQVDNFRGLSTYGRPAVSGIEKNENGSYAIPNFINQGWSPHTHSSSETLALQQQQQKLLQCYSHLGCAPSINTNCGPGRNSLATPLSIGFGMPSVNQETDVFGTEKESFKQSNSTNNDISQLIKEYFDTQGVLDDAAWKDNPVKPKYKPVTRRNPDKHAKLPKQRNGPNSLKLGRNTSSKFRGVTWHKRDKKWMARVWMKSKTINIGCFADEELAALMVDLCTIQKLPDQALKLNFPDEKERSRLMEKYQNDARLSRMKRDLRMPKELSCDSSNPLSPEERQGGFFGRVGMGLLHPSISSKISPRSSQGLENVYNPGLNLSDSENDKKYSTSAN